MQNNSKDIFETTSKTSVQKKVDNSNFFLSDDGLIFDSIKKTTSERAKRLNDYDFNLLKEDAYKDVSDDLFKLEYKIARTADEIKSYEAQIQAAIDINDLDLINELQTRYEHAKEDYESLVAIYNDKSISARVSDGILSLFGENLKRNYKDVQCKLNTFTEKFIEKLPKQFSSIIELKKSLSKLENINKSVDELISMNIPYGENINKYDQLSKYIIKANSIQSELSKFIKK